MPDENLIEDLGVALPTERPETTVEEIPDDRARRLQLIRASRPPPYHCVCGLKFPTAEEMLDHKHPLLPDGDASLYNFEQHAALRALPGRFRPLFDRGSTRRKRKRGLRGQSGVVKSAAPND